MTSKRIGWLLFSSWPCHFFVLKDVYWAKTNKFLLDSTPCWVFLQDQGRLGNERTSHLPFLRPSSSSSRSAKTLHLVPNMGLELTALRLRVCRANAHLALSLEGFLGHLYCHYGLSKWTAMPWRLPLKIPSLFSPKPIPGAFHVFIDGGQTGSIYAAFRNQQETPSYQGFQHCQG